ncbi:putative adenylate/guanylate cyclase [Desulfonatronospira thiodismutans ASO3-1]|uniref:Adenylate/guanylate cyclase n=1 Tax=Desulfonatronospira thiodismutans ASO3-1 TaxID=555779 RepID=D6SPY8_9BACT|nr:adenylate/guanylate cyclase [Desulfonatronospira thiodismutans]EFI34814.1 putative adenylate/guanylate cyclase [Desulfonatronospira thiodismutans ASO3-1]
MSDNFSFDLLYNYTNRNISRCLDQAQKIQSKYSKTAYPGYSRMVPGEYKEGFFSTLFLDIRESTKRTIDLGPEKTLLSMQALLPSLARIVSELDGFVVEYPGDGIMAHWDGAKLGNVEALKLSIKAAGWMDDCVGRIVNPILADYGIEPLLCGIGVDAGNIIITKVGNPDFISSKAFGPSINQAAKLSSSMFNSGDDVLIGKSVLESSIPRSGLSEYLNPYFSNFYTLLTDIGCYYHLDKLKHHFLLPDPRSKEHCGSFRARTLGQSLGLRFYADHNYYKKKGFGLGLG